MQTQGLARFYEDVKIHDELPEVTKGPLTTAHLMRWSAAIENWHRIHYDQKFSVEHEKLPDLLINGSWKQHILAQLLKDWAGPHGWVWRLSFQYRGMDTQGMTVAAFGEVTDKELIDDVGVVHCTIGIRNTTGATTTEGTSTVLLPRRDAGGPEPWSVETLGRVSAALP